MTKNLCRCSWSGMLGAEGIGVSASTIYWTLLRHGNSRLRDIDVFGEDLRELVDRYEWGRLGYDPAQPS
ncbi:hypothetical protein [Arthrobacter sp.]|uniref:hypothetical protein n=1 Tax=Arthrobacter sp. TaxID=1667 RepID=UPI003A9356A7